MASTTIYPIQTLTYGISSMSMDPEYVSSFSTSRGGDENIMELAPTCWIATFTTHALVGGKYDEWRAWVTTLRGGFGSFYLYDWRRKHPLNYPNGVATYGLMKTVGGAFTGVAKIKTVSGLDNHLITLKDLPNGYVVAPGDYLAFNFGASDSMRALHRVVSGGGGQSNSSGEITLNVEPAVRPGWAADTLVMLEEASCVMIVGQPFTDSVSWGTSKPSSDEQILRVKCRQRFKRV